MTGMDRLCFQHVRNTCLGVGVGRKEGLCQQRKARETPSPQTHLEGGKPGPRFCPSPPFPTHILVGQASDILKGINNGITGSKYEAFEVYEHFG